MNKFKILVIDDEISIHELISDAISATKYGKRIDMISAMDGEEGLNCLKYQPIDFCILDLKLPKMTGLEVLKAVNDLDIQCNCVMMSGHTTVEQAIEALKLGALDFFVKPIEYPELKSLVEQAYEHHQIESQKIRIKPPALSSIIGESEVMIDIYKQIRRVALSDVSVLLQGESGTGKELIAKAIHDCSDRVDQPFVAINCGAIPRELLESELFGHEKGAFTGAIAKKIGCFEQADGGTLFLDEIGDLNLDLQVKLLRVLQDNQIQPVGAVKKVKVNVRIISATHRNLAHLMINSKFREDLFFRLNVYPLEVPPLRERREDIPLLVDHFLKEIQNKYNSPNPNISEQAMDQLVNYCWKGNVRELENMMKRLILVMDPDNDITQIPEEMFQFKDTSPDQGETAVQNRRTVELSRVSSLADTEKASIENALRHFNYNILKTAQALKIGRDTLYRKIKLYDINNPGQRIST